MAHEWINRHPAISFTIILGMLMLILVAGYVSSAAQGVSPPVSKFEERLLELDKEAIEEAYKTQIQHLFEIWMRDDRGQPDRAVVGARQARKAYIGAMEGIEKRALETKLLRERQ